jgi:hypothetical protein
LEVGGGSAEGGTGEPAAGHAAEKPLTHLVEEIKTQADHAADRNGTQP